MLNIDINFMVIVFIAVAAAMVCGAVWYAPGVFGNAWMRLANVSPAAAQETKKRMLITFFAYAAVATTLFTILVWAEAKTALQGVMLGLWLGFGLTGMSLLIPYLWEGRPVKLFLITAGNAVCSLTIMCAVMAHLIGVFGIKAF
jgi:hypothetical protein